MRARMLGAFAFVTTGLMLGGMVGTASAQQIYEKSIVSVCNTTTGQYDVTVTIDDNAQGPYLLADAFYWYSQPSGDSPDIDSVFNPSTVPLNGTSTMQFSIPGDSIEVEAGWYIRELDEQDFINDSELAGDCVAVATTTPPTSAVVTTTTAAVGAVAATPSYTG